MAICGACGTHYMQDRVHYMQDDIEFCTQCGALIAERQTQERDIEDVLHHVDQSKRGRFNFRALTNPHARPYVRKSRSWKRSPEDYLKLALDDANQKFWRKHRKPRLDDEAIEIWENYLAGQLSWTKGQKDGFFRRQRGNLSDLELGALRSVAVQPSTRPRYRLTSWVPAGEAEQEPRGFADFKYDLERLDNSRWLPFWTLCQRHELAHKFGRFLNRSLLDKLLDCPRRPHPSAIGRSRMVRRQNPHL